MGEHLPVGGEEALVSFCFSCMWEMNFSFSFGEYLHWVGAIGCLLEIGLQLELEALLLTRLFVTLFICGLIPIPSIVGYVSLNAELLVFLNAERL